MGMEITVSSLEEMCDLMCDNIIPAQKPVISGDKEKNKKNCKLPLETISEQMYNTHIPYTRNN